MRRWRWILALMWVFPAACGARPGIVATSAVPAATLSPGVPTRALPATAATGAPTPWASGQAATATAFPPTAAAGATRHPRPTPSRTAPPTATPPGWIGPADVPAGVNPLTGEVAADPDLLAHRPLAVKVVNEPDCARPQYGLNQAAVVFEHYVEAWGTRFTAIFYGYPADRIGAVRSARLIDLELPAIFDAALVTSGSSGGVRQRLEASDFAERVVAYQWDPRCPPFCNVPIEAVACRDLEHTMFTRLPDLWVEAAGQGFDRAPDLTGWAFSPRPPAGGTAARAVRVGYLNSPVDWRFAAETGDYHRWQDGNRHVAAETRQRLNARNVVVLFAHHLYTDIRESTNFYSLEVQLWGEGRALVFRDGQAFEARWVRDQRAGLFQLVDAAGQIVPLKPGRTWFELVALDSPVTAGPGDWVIEAAILPQLTPPQP
jgi:hypothetical protein